MAQIIALGSKFVEGAVADTHSNQFVPNENTRECPLKYKFSFIEGYNLLLNSVCMILF